LLSTLGTWMLSRTRSKRSSLLSPGRLTVSLTWLRGLPRISSTILSTGKPRSGLSSTARIWSPERNPARAAGEPVMGAITVTASSR
jgi:hypothetical protein